MLTDYYREKIYDSNVVKNDLKQSNVGVLTHNDTIRKTTPNDEKYEVPQERKTQLTKLH